MTFWSTPTWHEYERLCGDEPGTRARLLDAATWRTRVVDLSLSEAELWRGVRCSYHSIVNRLTERDRTFGVTIHGVMGAHGTIERAHALHRREAGRETRPQASWDAQGRWLRDGCALVAVAYRVTVSSVNEPLFIDDVSFAYAVRHKDWAYYFSAASCEPNIQHAVQWALMLHLKAVGVRWYELGWQGEAKDDKGKQIEFFRRGFGGFDIPAKEAPALCGR